MILINLLPPELRKARRSGVNPVWFAAAAGLLICFSVAGTWMWIKYSRIPAAEQALEAAQAELDAATAKATQVKAIEEQITAFKQMYDRLVGLIARKVFWARTLDDFANLLSHQHENRWTMEGYDVRCTQLTIASTASASVPRRGGGSAGESVTYSFRASLRIYGDEQDKAGDYIRSFFQTVDLSRFWRENGFAGMSEQSYHNDTPTWKPDIKRVIVDLPLEWQRVKEMAASKGVER